MVSAHKIDDLAPRRPATIASLDARLSVWGQAARDAAGRRAEALIEGAVLYVERVGRNAEVLRGSAGEPAEALLGTDYASLVELGASLLPAEVERACRLLWVDPDRLRARLVQALAPSLETARIEVRRRQALYRRRARLWQQDQARLDRLREEVEAMRVPRCHGSAPEQVARGLLVRHQREAIEERGLTIRPGSINRWIAQLESRIEERASA